jgi:hypothetical protein
MQPKILKSALYNFHIIGLMLTLKFILSAQKNNILASFAIIISVFIIFVLYKMAVHFCETEYNGIIKYGQAFSYIFLLYFFGSIVSSIVIFIYTSFIDTNFLGMTLEMVLKMYDDIKYPLDDKMTKILETIYKPTTYSFLNIFFSMIVAAFWGLILAAFVKKEKSIFEK